MKTRLDIEVYAWHFKNWSFYVGNDAKKIILEISPDPNYMAVASQKILKRAVRLAGKL